MRGSCAVVCGARRTRTEVGVEFFASSPGAARIAVVLRAGCAGVRCADTRVCASPVWITQDHQASLSTNAIRQAKHFCQTKLQPDLSVS